MTKFNDATVVEVTGDLAVALTALKRRVETAGLAFERKKRQHYRKPGEAKRWKSARARAKVRKTQKRFSDVD